MNDKQRNSYLAIADGVPETFPIIYHIDRLTRKDEVCRWLLRNKVTGQKLLELYAQNDSSILQLCSNILKRINKDSVNQKIIAGKDYLT